MTQVVNGLLGWEFTRCRPRLVATRDGGGRAHEAVLWVRAAWTLLRSRPGRSVVVGHLSQRGSFVREGALLWVARCRGLRVVAHLHGSRFPAFAHRHPRFARSVLRAADLVLVLSRETESVVDSLVPDTPVRRVPNTAPRGRPAAKEDVVVLAGLLSERKGVDVLLAAWRRSAPVGWRLVLAGPVAAGFELGSTGGSVSCPGQLRNSDVRRLLETARIAVLPSRAEAMPVFLLEAMARDVAVIASTVGGIPELLGDDGGWLVPAGDVDALADALTALTRQPELRQEWARRARARFESRFAPEIVYRDLEESWLGDRWKVTT